MQSQPFAFSFSGADIEDDEAETSAPAFLHPTSSTHCPNHSPICHAAETGTLSRPRTTAAGAFPISGTPLLPAQAHRLDALLATLPSRLAYGGLDIRLDDGEVIRILRRELWDVRLQLMAEDGLEEGGDDERGVAGVGMGNAGEVVEGLGKDDVKTGVYEGGFKSWECSVDLVRILDEERRNQVEDSKGRRILEMGCGTALPSLALLQWHLKKYLLPSPTSGASSPSPPPLRLTLADYNSSVLSLVTLPNILLAWAQSKQLLSNSNSNSVSYSAPAPETDSKIEEDGEFEIGHSTLEDFQADMRRCNIELAFVSGAWSDEFVQLVSRSTSESDLGKDVTRIDDDMLVLAAETIYSPFALRSFVEALMAILISERKGFSQEGWTGRARAVIGAKKVYFGVGGSVEDFVVESRGRGGTVKQVREEEDGVRRAVVEVWIDTEKDELT